MEVVAYINMNCRKILGKISAYEFMLQVLPKVRWGEIK